VQDPNDPHGRLNYRRLIAWPARIEREWPFLEGIVVGAPARTVVDLGCGTGEHVRHLASQGFRAVGVDRSEVQIEEARDYEGEFGGLGPEFLLGEASALAGLTDELFGAALCLGNVLPHLEDDAVAAALAALADRLLPGGRFLLQIINYERVFARGIRALPINLRDDPESPEREIAFVRLMTPEGDRHIRFYPTTLALCPGEEPPVEVSATRELRLRAWRQAEVARALERAGFRVEATYGDMTGGPFVAEDSSDLVVVAQCG